MGVQLQSSAISQNKPQESLRQNELKNISSDVLEPFLDKEYRDNYLDGFVKGRIAHQIRTIRETRGMSQKAFGRKIDKPQSVVSRLENTEYGALNIHTLLDIAKALDIALDVKFTDYARVLSSDLSENALKVPTIQETYSAYVTNAGVVSATQSTLRAPISVVMITPSVSITVGTTGANLVGLNAYYGGTGGRPVYKTEFDALATSESSGPAVP